jgi:hypothetical protein
MRIATQDASQIHWQRWLVEAEPRTLESRRNIVSLCRNSRSAASGNCRISSQQVLYGRRTISSLQARSMAICMPRATCSCSSRRQGFPTSASTICATAPPQCC